MPKFSFSTNALTRYDLLSALEKIHENGFEAVEILADIPHAFLPNLSPQDVKAVQSKLSALNLAVSNINANTANGLQPGTNDLNPDNFEPSLCNPDPVIRQSRIEYSILALDFASALGAQNISITSGKLARGDSVQNALGNLRQSLAPLLEHAEKIGVNIGIETEPGLLVENTANLLALLGEIKHPRLGANFDIGHAVVNGESLEHSIQKLGKNIFHVHCEDIKGKEHFHLVPGKGELSFKKIFSIFNATGYNGWLAWELYTYRDSPDAALQATRAFMDKHPF